MAILKNKFVNIAICAALICPNISFADGVKSKGETELVSAFEYADSGDAYRKLSSGIALRTLKAEKKLAKKPNQRMDYTDHYVPLKPIKFLDYKVAILEEEYMIKYIGCCVDHGIGAVLELNKPIEDLRAFAKQNKCKLTEEIDIKSYAKDNSLKLKPMSGKYSYLSCRERYVSQIME